MAKINEEKMQPNYALMESRMKSTQDIEEKKQKILYDK